MRYLASRQLLESAYFEDFATAGPLHPQLTPRAMLMDAMSLSVAPMNTRRLQFACHFRETEIGRVFSSINSEPWFGSLADIYVMAAEFWTKAPEPPAIAA